MSALTRRILPQPARAEQSYAWWRHGGWLGQGQDNERFAGHGADIVMKAYNLDAGDLLTISCMSG